MYTNTLISCPLRSFLITGWLGSIYKDPEVHQAQLIQKKKCLLIKGSSVFISHSPSLVNVWMMEGTETDGVMEKRLTNLTAA